MKTHDGKFFEQEFQAVEIGGDLIIGKAITGIGVGAEEPLPGQGDWLRTFLELDEKIKPGQPFYRVVGKIELITSGNRGDGQ